MVYLADFHDLKKKMYKESDPLLIYANTSRICVLCVLIYEKKEKEFRYILIAYS